MAKFDAHLKCSFCGKSQDQVRKLIAGPGVYICDECIDLCNEILDEELIDTQAKLNNSPPINKKLPTSDPKKNIPLELTSIPKPLVPLGGKTTIIEIIIKQLSKNGALFNVGMFEYDNNFIFMPWKSAQNFLQLGDVANNIEIFLKDYKSSDATYLNLKKILNDRFEIVDWKKQNNTFINALNVEKNVMFLILTLIILVAAFNIISSMIMLVNAKSGDIALLRTIGSSRGAIIKIFLLNVL